MIFYKLSLAKSREVIPWNDFLFCIFTGRGTAQKSQPETYDKGRYMYKYTNICVILIHSLVSYPNDIKIITYILR